MGIQHLISLIPDSTVVSIYDLLSQYIHSILLSILVGPFLVGLAYSFTRLSREKDMQVSNIGYGFEKFTSSFFMELTRSVFIFLWSLLLIVPGIIKLFAYSMAPYIIADNPNMTAREDIKASKEMMYGHKGRLFGLHLSFIGWMLLVLIPYYVATYNFKDRLQYVEYSFTIINFYYRFRFS